MMNGLMLFTIGSGYNIEMYFSILLTVVYLHSTLSLGLEVNL